MRRHRVVILVCVLFLMSVVLAACGGSEDGEADGASESGSTTAETSGSAATPESTGTQGSPTAESSASPVAETREIEHALGTTEITGIPERIVVLEWPYVEALLAMGIQPVGVADIEGYTSLVNTDPALSEDVTDVGIRQEPSLESIAALEPDLIIGMRTRHTELYPTLSDIAPTVIFDPFPEDGEQLQRMKDTVLEIAEAVGQPDAGQAVVDELNATIDAAAQTLDDAGLSGEPFVLAQTLKGEDTQLRLFHDNATVVQIMEQMGLENAWEADFEQIGFTTVGLEALTEVEQANFFYVPYVGATLFEGNPVWDDLAFVQEDRIYDLSGAWVLAGPLSGQEFVKKVVTALTGGSTATPETGSATDSPRTIQHALGELEIEGTPERVVVLEWTYAEDLLAVGVQPVGVADVEGYTTWLNVEPALSDDVADVGTRQEPSLESIAALEPDLIIGIQFRHEPIYDDLSSIAPTLLFNPYPEDPSFGQLDEMRQTFLAIAEAVGRTAEAEQVLSDLDASFEEAASALEEAGAAGTPFLLVQAFTSQDQPQMRVFTDTSMASQIMERIGLENAWEGEFDPYGFNTVGVEALTTVDDASFFYVVQSDDDVFANQWAENPVWQSLAFVQEGRTYPLGGDTWLFGGPLSSQLIAEKIVDALAS